MQEQSSEAFSTRPSFGVLSAVSGHISLQVTGPYLGR